MLFCFVPFLDGSVAPNPFLKPGSNRKPPPPSPPIATPRPTVRPNVAQEIEFKGYFILQGKAYFSLFNKKVNHSEWISISEKTYEDFIAQEFNVETETLTILYEGQTFDLSLIQSKSGSGLPSLSNGLSSNPGPGSSPAQPKMPRYMPPKPKNTPKIPSWLVNNKSSNSRPRPPSQSEILKNKRNPVTSLPGLPYPGFVPRRTPSGSTSSTPLPSVNPFANQSNVQSLPPNPSATTQATNPEANSNSQTNENSAFGNLNTEIDLENLPPPPPPPNILPPSPPPNLLPSRE
jgi:hypothetical protein